MLPPPNHTFDALKTGRIRVFVSSAFRDMGAERDELAKRVFPRLRKLCETRGLTWSDVDLRWGVTEEAVTADKTAEVCLREVDRCRPFFIGILGGQYGPLTETEIEHGALTQPINGLARFYFRAGSGVDALEKLKLRIRESGLAWRDGYRSPEELGAWVQADLEQLIEELFPVGTTHAESLDQASLTLSRNTVYVERPALNDALQRHFTHGERQLVVTGAVGSGKSALLARWTARIVAENPDALVIFHSIGISAYSGDWRSLVRRLIVKAGGEVPRDLAVPAWRDALQRALDRAAASRRVVIAIDALNQLEDSDSALDLPWLPESFAPGVRVALSTLPGAPLEETRRRGFPEIAVTPLTIAEKRCLIHDYLDFYGKQLTDARMDRLCAAETTSSPLFLRAVLDELRQFGSYLQLDERIDSYLRAVDSEDLFGMILGRYELDYERERPALVRDVCSLLSSARRGLSEAELLDLLGGTEGPLPKLWWSPLFLAAESSLVTRSGLLNFAHDHIRRAARRKYSDGTLSNGRNSHILLAEYFASSEVVRRKAEELPWQLQQANRRDELRDVLLDPPLLASIWEVSDSDLKRYWAWLETAGLNRATEYRKFIAEPERLGSYAIFVTNLLEDTGYPNEAAAIYEFLLNRVQDRGWYAGILGNLALLRKRTGDLQGALDLHKREEAICREVSDDEGLERSLSHQALILSLFGRREESLDLHKQEEALARKRGDLSALAKCLGNQALIHRALGERHQALALFEEQERLFRRDGNREGVQDALFDQAIAYWQQGDLERGLEIFRERERDAREMKDRRWLARAKGMQGVVHQSVGRFSEALDCFVEQMQLCREIRDWINLVSALNNMGRVLLKLGRREEAASALDEVETLCRQQNYPGALQSCLQNKGEARLDDGDVEGALDLFREQQQICERIGDLDGLAGSLLCQALAMRRLGKKAEAMRLLKQCETIARKLDDPAILQPTLIQQAVLLGEEDDFAGAFALFDASEEIGRRIGALDDLRVSISNRGELHKRLGQNGEALGCFREEAKLARELRNREAEDRALRRQVGVLLVMENAEGALEVFRQLEGLTADPVEKAQEATNQAAILDALERRAEAEEAARRAIDLVALAQLNDSVAEVRMRATEILMGIS